MKPEITELIGLSKSYGMRKEFAETGCSNSSFKDKDTIWINPCGLSLVAVSEEKLVALSREKLRGILQKKYPDDPLLREDKLKEDLLRSVPDPGKPGRPSVEVLLHELIAFKYVVHLHPAIINGLLCSWNAKSMTLKLFGDKVLFIPYTDPGYSLLKKMEEGVNNYRDKFSNDPHMVFLENHGSFVSADSADEIRELYQDIILKIHEQVQPIPENLVLPYNPILDKVLPSIRMLLSDDQPKIIRHRHNILISKYYKSQLEFNKISLPLSPDINVYCRNKFLYIEHSSSAVKIMDSFRTQLGRFRQEYGFPPKIIVIKDMGVFAVDESYESAEEILNVYEEQIRICYYSSFFGGTKFLTLEETAFIDQREPQNLIRKDSQVNVPKDKLKNKIVIVTGGASGFGAGIAEALFRQRANVVIADINEEAGLSLTSALNQLKSPNRAKFVRTDVSDPVSVKNLIYTTVSEFGGLDIMISNAGILKAGGLDEIEPVDFSVTTNINYNGYFYCAKYSSEIMKLQNQEKPEYFSDIIQINSKSGLRGSNRNFTYAGAKFGGIGLTQSFALELAPFRIKVNSICPGNFYEGPLWADPLTGLFVQYLKAGKVPGAKSIEEVRKFYEDQVPLKRGCKLEDVIKAILYVIDQEYETGQAIPVTGGQVMLG